MAEKLTAQQRQAITDRGGMLLVSAAAGSGKTKVLVDRLISYLNDPLRPANLDDFLIITYTKAAAAELRGKIGAKLSACIALEPENRHLQHQLQRLYLAKISTVHAFCGDVLRQYAYALDLPADFRVADENECQEIRALCMERVLDRAYSEQMEDPAFRCFVDSQGLGRDDRLVPEIVARVFDSARCHLDPEGWLEQCLNNANTGALTDASETVWGRYLMEDLFHWLDLQIPALEQCVDMAASAGNMEKPVENLTNTLAQLRRLRECTTWDAIVESKDISFGTLTFGKKADDQVKEQIKAVRDALKKGLQQKCRSFQDESGAVLSDLQETAEAMAGMAHLVRSFSREYTRAKRARRVLDFGDLEQAMLDLLLGKSRSALTAAGREIAQSFREIMVDEYQDSNEVQDAIFDALSRERKNCFMVGDVKQSIYQFRLADPGIFLKKYASFLPADLAQPGQPRKVLLSRNFRSGGAVLSAVNDVFSCCMSEHVGGLAYGEQEALAEGVAHIPLGGPEVELSVLDVQEAAYPEEAAYVARRVKALLDSGATVREGEGLRPVQPRDIAILLRSPNSCGSDYTAALGALGIRCVTGGGADLLRTPEIQALRALLTVLSNPRQDIPLLAALTSPVFGFTADDLAVLRAGNKGCCIYDALAGWEHPKAKAFVELLSGLRRSARLLSLAQLLQHIFATTRLDSLYGAMSDGGVKRSNLLAFYELAAGFESGGHRDLEQFLHHLSAMEEKGISAPGEQGPQDAVTLMSIHKSKGLEFPVVFVAGLSRNFNREGVRAQVLCDQELGLGLSVVDRENRVRYPSLAKRAIAVKAVSDSLSEEMRVLYVAMTRARDRLIMTYAVKNPEKDLSATVNRMGIGSRELLTADAVCPGDWVMLAALQRTEAGALFAAAGRPAETELSRYPWDIRLVTCGPVEPPSARTGSERRTLPEETLRRMEEGLAYSYPYLQAASAPSKQTATDRKGRQKDEEAHAQAPLKHQMQRHWRKPMETFDSTAYGTAVHIALQHLDYSQCTDARAVERQLEQLELRQLLTSRQRQMVEGAGLHRFFDTALGSRLRGGGELLREFKFSVLEDGERFDPALVGEKILLQGVVDCALVEDDGITVIDFKTDRVTEETVLSRAERYRPQVEAYGDALSRIFGKPVKRSCLYFFQLHRFVDM